MGRLRLTLPLVVVALVVGCVARAPAALPSKDEGLSSPSYPADMPPEKLKAIQAAANWTMPPAAGTPVAWLDRPYTGPTPTDPPDTAAGLPTCAANEVEISFEGWGDSEFGSTGMIVARNLGGAACLIQGPPQVELLDSGGRTLATAGVGDGPVGPAVLRPGLSPHPTGALDVGALGPEYAPGYGYGGIWINGFCDTARTLRVRLPNGTAGDLSIPAPPSSHCAVDSGRLTTTFFNSVEGPQPTTFSASALLGFISLPDEVVVGQPFHFTVALQNDTRLPISLDLCPVYTIDVTVRTASGQLESETSHEYQLNCDGVKTIATGSAVTFDMEATVPSTTPLTDMVYVAWLLGALDRPMGTMMTTKDRTLKLRAP
jgi:hypothetical protein